MVAASFYFFSQAFAFTHKLRNSGVAKNLKKGGHNFNIFQALRPFITAQVNLPACTPQFTVALSICPIKMGLKPTGFLHHNQIFDVMIEKNDCDIKYLNMTQKASKLLAHFNLTASGQGNCLLKGERQSVKLWIPILQSLVSP